MIDVIVVGSLSFILASSCISSCSGSFCSWPDFSSLMSIPIEATWLCWSFSFGDEYWMLNIVEGSLVENEGTSFFEIFRFIWSAFGWVWFFLSIWLVSFSTIICFERASDPFLWAALGMLLIDAIVVGSLSLIFISSTSTSSSSNSSWFIFWLEFCLSFISVAAILLCCSFLLWVAGWMFAREEGSLAENTGICLFFFFLFFGWSLLKPTTFSLEFTELSFSWHLFWSNLFEAIISISLSIIVSLSSWSFSSLSMPLNEISEFVFCGLNLMFAIVESSLVEKLGASIRIAFWLPDKLTSSLLSTTLDAWPCSGLNLTDIIGVISLSLISAESFILLSFIFNDELSFEGEIWINLLASFWGLYRIFAIIEGSLVVKRGICFLFFFLEPVSIAIWSSFSKHKISLSWTRFWAGMKSIDSIVVTSLSLISSLIVDSDSVKTTPLLFKLSIWGLYRMFAIVDGSLVEKRGTLFFFGVTFKDSCSLFKELSRVSFICCSTSIEIIVSKSLSPNFGAAFLPKSRNEREQISNSLSEGMIVFTLLSVYFTAFFSDFCLIWSSPKENDEMDSIGLIPNGLTFWLSNSKVFSLDE